MKTIPIEALTRILRAGAAAPRVVASGNFATPWELVRAVDQALPEYTLHVLNGQVGLPDREGVTLETCFVGPGMRRSPRLAYCPARLSAVPHLFRGPLLPDIVLLHVAPPHDGAVSLGIEVDILPAAIAAVRARGGLVIAQVNPRMPYTLGDSVLPVEAVDYAVEVDVPLPTVDKGAPDDDCQAIGQRLASRVADGATVQLGIGAVPDAAVPFLSSRRGLAIWSEMISDGTLALERAGALDAEVPVVASFMFGSQELYDWVDHNPRVHMTVTERTNEPALIARNRGMTSVNTGLEVDLHAQVNASRVRGRIHSGFGGQTDFIVGAMHAPGGQAIVALRSWHPTADVSTIVPEISGAITSFQPSMVITEQGEALLVGATEAEQARRLIDHAAHPDARAWLHDEAARLGISTTRGLVTQT